MAFFACGTRDEPYMPPPGQTPCCWSAACHGGIRNIYKLKATSCGLFCIRKPCPRIHVRSGMQFPLTAPLGNCIPLRLQIPGRIFHYPDDETVLDDTLACVRWMYSEWDGLSGWMGFRKVCPGICLWNGMRFPVEGSGGKCDPEFAIGVGCSFPTGP